jgi:hypothetical protein
MAGIVKGIRLHRPPPRPKHFLSFRFVGHDFASGDVPKRERPAQSLHVGRLPFFPENVEQAGGWKVDGSRFRRGVRLHEHAASTRIRFADQRVRGTVVFGVAWLFGVLLRKKAGIPKRRRDAAFVPMIDGIFGRGRDDCPYCIRRAEVVTTRFRLTPARTVLASEDFEEI